MEKEKASWHYNSFWSIPRPGSFYLSSFWKSVNSNRPSGFTLLELLIVIGLIGILTVVLMVADPITQFNKANDVKKRDTLRQINNALDQYYSDKNSYPSVATMNSAFGSNLTDPANANVTYMKKLPSKEMGVGPFYYVGAGGQWYAIFWKKVYIDSTNPTENAVKDCPLEINSCVPQPAAYNAAPPAGSKNKYLCSFGGDVNCSDINGMTALP